MPRHPTVPSWRCWLAALLVAAAVDGFAQTSTTGTQMPGTGGATTLGLSLTPVFESGPSFPSQSGPALLSAADKHRQAEGFYTSLSAEAGLTFTDNVNLQPSGQAQSDVVTEFRPVLGLSTAGSRVHFDLLYAPTAYVYANTTDNNDIRQKLDALLSAELIRRFFFVEAAANIQDTYLSAFAPRPESGGSGTNNLVQQTTLRFSPYVAKQTDRGWDYLIRNDTYWNTYDNASLDASVVDRVTVGLRAPPARVRTEFDYTYLYTKYESQPDGFYQQVGRVRPILAVTPRLKVGPRVGYESNDYGSSDYSGAVYGGELAWTPSPRTSLSGFLEHRFFGESYGLNFSHRSRRTVWRIGGTRDTYTSIDQTLNLAPGGTAAALNDAFRASIPDSAERARAVQQFLASTGLPANLTDYYTFYAAQIYVAEQWTGSVTFLGRRNTLELTVFWQDNQPITGDGASLPLYLSNANSLKQRGGTASLTHKLTARSNVTLSAGRVYSEGDGTLASSGVSAESTEDTFRVVLSHQIASRTQGSIGARWVDSSGATSYQEHALFMLVAHKF